MTWPCASCGPFCAAVPPLGRLILRTSVLGAIIALQPLAQRATAQKGGFVQEATLLKPHPGVSVHFGQSMALSGDTALVGSYGDNSAEVFIRSGFSWSHQATLASTDSGTFDSFSYSTAIQGDVAICGAPNHGQSEFYHAGAAYVFVRTGGSWVQEAKLTAPDAAAGDFFGSAIALSGNTAIIGSPSFNSGPGAAYVFVRTDGQWSLQQKLEIGTSIDWFGIAISVEGDTAIIGAQAELGGGGAYTFSRTDNTWDAGTRLPTPPGLSGSSNLGCAVSLSGTTAVVGALMSTVAGIQSGAAYVYEETGGRWEFRATLSAVDGEDSDNFGRPISLNGNLMIVGAVGGDSATAQDSGSSYVFLRENNTWSQQIKLVASDISSGDSFGNGVALCGDTAIVGAPEYDLGSSINCGVAYVFRLDVGQAWADLGNGMGGSHGQPLFTAQGSLYPHSPVSLHLSNAKAFAPSLLVVGLSPLLGSFKSGILVPAPDILFPLFSDFFGGISFSGPWPAGVPSGITTYFQWWIQDPAGPKGFAASNALAGTTP